MAELASEELLGGPSPKAAGPPLAEVEYWTDPLCCWSWALEPSWRRLRHAWGDRIAWRYRLGGMIPDWSTFADPLSGVESPAQVAPHWYHVRQLTGMPLDERIWVEDPPASSYPASIACKAAECQGREAGDRYLRRVREGVMLERKNVARREVLLEVAADLARTSLGRQAFDLERFQRDLDDRATVDAFRDDVRDARYFGIGRFPTLVIRVRGGRRRMLVGFRPYAALLAALTHVLPELADDDTSGCISEYVAEWGRVTPWEIAVAFSLEPGRAGQALDDLVAGGVLARVAAGGTTLYQSLDRGASRASG